MCLLYEGFPFLLTRSNVPFGTGGPAKAELSSINFVSKPMMFRKVSVVPLKRFSPEVILLQGGSASGMTARMVHSGVKPDFQRLKMKIPVNLDQGV